MTLLLSRLRRERSGAAIIEFALLLPVLLLILLGVIEFGLYFFRSQFVHRTVSSAATAIQIDPSDAPAIQETALSSGMDIVKYDEGKNFICAASFPTPPAARNGSCTGNGPWDVSKPPGVAGNDYYVKVIGHVEQTSITPLFKDFIPNIHIASIVHVGGGGGKGTGEMVWEPLPTSGATISCNGSKLGGGSAPQCFLNANKSPDQYCKEKGYSGADSPCKVTFPVSSWGTGGTRQSFGALAATKTSDDTWQWGCMAAEPAAYAGSPFNEGMRSNVNISTDTEITCRK